MSTNTLTTTPTASLPAPDRKIFFGAAVLLAAVTALGLVVGVGSASIDAPTTGAAVPTAGAGGHVAPDHIVQPR